MPKVALNLPAPDFTLNNFRSEPIQLSDFSGTHNVLIVFNRGFT